MFTGLIKEIGRVKTVSATAEGKKIEILCPHIRPHLNIDDSVAVNGVCLTVEKLTTDSFFATAVHVTLEKTTTGLLKKETPVNLEMALAMGDRLGGHVVQGHVGAIGEIVKIEDHGKNKLITLSYPEKLSRYFILEGSVAIEGISLTIAQINKEKLYLQVSIIPHTVKETTLQFKKIGDKVNLEVDLFAKYVESILLGTKKSQQLSTNTILEFLR